MDEGNSMINEVESVLLSEGKAQESIKKSSVLKWMESDDIEVLGAVYELITEERFYTKITPYLVYEDYRAFLETYMRRCILENPSHDSDWADTRYTISWAFVNWFKHFWLKDNQERSESLHWKNWLRRIYENGDDDIKDCINTAILEHLSKDKEIRQFFSDF